MIRTSGFGPQRRKSMPARMSASGYPQPPCRWLTWALDERSRVPRKLRGIKLSRWGAEIRADQIASEGSRNSLLFSRVQFSIEAAGVSHVVPIEEQGGR